MQYIALARRDRHLVPRHIRRMLVRRRYADCGQAVVAYKEMLQAALEACQRHDSELRIVCEDCGHRNMQAAEEVRCYVPVVRTDGHHIH